MARKQRKPFLQSGVGRALMSVAGVLVPGAGGALGGILSGTGTVGQAIQAISDSTLPPDQKVIIRTKILELEAQEIERDIVAQQEVSKRWESDNNAGALTRYIRPMTCILLTVLMLGFTFLSSTEKYDFAVPEAWIGFWQIAYMTVLGGYFVGKSVEKTAINRKK